MIHFKKRMWLIAVFMSVAMTMPAMAQNKDCAIVLLHGKWGEPISLASFGRAIQPSCVPKTVEMPWSRRRNYDATYMQAVAEIEKHVTGLRAQGYKRVLVGGQSFGGNVALGYMAESGDADGIVMLSPGHQPALMYERGIGRAAVDQAKRLVSEGKGTEMLTMEDLNQGQRQNIAMRAEVLWSYFDPAGLGHMPGTIARFKKPVPLFWVIGTKDPLFSAGEAFAYRLAPAHPASKYLTVDADHFNLPSLAAEQISAWLKSLP
jgi:pimeloyl-ACP methyl ester carboxylesterase